ncbi:hypothetical protein D3874_25735 [Oleomonas cavernae]|uniref:histidine kinase n=1 Tax=Oleomonas cavernae TaxID=2320859 RepID=A0A418VTQ4_9PROT|nr:histidine kinase dimerization/phospho-acceptor domain-containing protein [Oleomonas cavernae]RJF80533.1 hypothetical protein D3874_25735 [Oleomonas cavernae]
MKTYSLRRATLVALIVPLLLAVTVVAGIAIWLAHESISALRDDQMQQEAAFILLLAKHEAAESEVLGFIEPADSERLNRLLGARTGFRIWSDTLVVTQSGAVPAAGAPPSPGFSDHVADGQEWRRFGLRHPELPITVEVAEPQELRAALTWQVARSLGLALLLLVAIVCIIAYARIAAALHPMKQISREIDSRDDDDLHPLGGHRIPAEIVPLFAAINRLLARLRATLDREREFTDNAAHELRTPLAALKTRAQIAERALAGDPARQEILAELNAAADRAAGVIDQLLLVTRLKGAADRFEPVDLSALTEDIARDLAPAAIDKDQDFTADIASAIRVKGHAGALAMLVRNLIDNAIRYTPAGGGISVALRLEPPGTVVLEVADTGPGYPRPNESVSSSVSPASPMKRAGAAWGSRSSSRWFACTAAASCCTR